MESVHPTFAFSQGLYKFLTMQIFKIHCYQASTLNWDDDSASPVRCIAIKQLLGTTSLFSFRRRTLSVPVLDHKQSNRSSYTHQNYQWAILFVKYLVPV